MNAISKIYKQIIKSYKQLFGAQPPKLFRYITIALILLVIRNIFWKLFNRLRSYPPGPIGLPFLGCLLAFAGKPRKFLVDIANKYGPITYVPLFLSNNVFISHPKIIRKLYQDEKINDRPALGFSAVPSITELNGHKWNKRRQFASISVLNLTNTAFILSHTKQCIDKYIESIIKDKCIQNNELWYPNNDLHFITLYIIFSASFDSHLSINDPFIKQFTDFTETFAVRARIAIALNSIASGLNVSLPNWLLKRLLWNNTQQAVDTIIKWMNNNGFIIDVEKNILKRKDDSNDNKVYINFLISKLNAKQITIADIITDVRAILGASIHTTSKSLEYGFLLLAKYPHIQQKVYDELLSVMKRNDLKQFDFKILNQLHVFRAFIHEVLRIATVVPTGLAHITRKDHMIEIDGRKIVIPKKTILHTNTYYIHKYLNWNDIDKKKVSEKENNEIHLEYWLNEEGKFKMNDNFILFGVGKRDCVGRSMALKAMFAIFGLMIEKYKFMSDGDNEINIKQKWGFILGVDPPIGVRIAER